jgi:hypothetical protein
LIFCPNSSILFFGRVAPFLAVDIQEKMHILNLIHK